MKWTLELFIQEATRKHGEYFIYDNVVFNKITDKVSIICKEHGEFQQSANKHLAGQECKQCSRIKSGLKRRNTTEKFIRKAKEIHNELYNYDKTNYTTDKNDIIIICKIHDEFVQKASYHLQGNGCPTCAGNIKKTIEEFIKKANIIHNNKYSYEKSVYTNANTIIIITCPEHGDFEQTPAKHINRKQGCHECSTSFPYSQESYIEKANKTHSNIYSYDYTQYTGIHNKIIITCIIHGEFEQEAASHLRGCGCPSCGRIRSDLSRRSNTTEFIIDAELIHGNKFDYSKVIYTTAKEDIIIICYEHGEFKQTPDYHLQGGSCSKCNPKKSWSNVSTLWLESIKVKVPNLEYALNKGEHSIKNSRYKADGYDPHTNTIYEFHGCFWHGCSCKKNNLDESIKLIQEIRYRKTLEREEFIKSQGYSLITMWECQWKNLLKIENMSSKI
jgi:hypothetical protein